jgi:hypothetical protein
MRKWFRGVAAVLALVGLVAVAASAWAATSVDLQLVDNGQPVGGAQIEILSTTGMTETTTDANGLAHFQMTGKFFRVHVNGQTLNAAYEAGQGLVVVEINNN